MVMTHTHAQGQGQRSLSSKVRLETDQGACITSSRGSAANGELVLQMGSGIDGASL